MQGNDALRNELSKPMNAELMPCRKNGRRSKGPSMFPPSVDRIWKPIVAGLCGSIAHSLLMYFKSRGGLLPSFQPYQNLQATLSHLVGTAVDPMVPWALSFLNGSTLVGFIFGYSYQWLPGTNGVTKGAVYGMLGWSIMGLAFFPIIGLGFFALNAELGISPALFSLAMLLTYSVVMGAVYDALYAKGVGADRKGQQDS